MDLALSQAVSQLVHFGWNVRSQTNTTASLETRTPFNWLWFALSILLFFGFGGLLYIAFWLIVSRAHLFVHEENGQVVSSGDTWLVDRQKSDEAAARRLAMDIKQHGFWKVMWPSILATILMIIFWILVVRFVFWLAR